MVLDPPLTLSLEPERLLGDVSAPGSDLDMEWTTRSAVTVDGSARAQQSFNGSLSSLELRRNPPRPQEREDDQIPLPVGLTESLRRAPFSVTKLEHGREFSYWARGDEDNPVIGSLIEPLVGDSGTGGVGPSRISMETRKTSSQSMFRKRVMYEVTSGFLESIREFVRNDIEGHSARRLVRLATERFALACTLSLRELSVGRYVERDFFNSERGRYARDWMLLLEEHLRRRGSDSGSVSGNPTTNRSPASRQFRLEPNTPETRKQLDSIGGLSYTITAKLKPVRPRPHESPAGHTMYVTVRMVEKKVVTEFSLETHVQGTFETETGSTSGEEDSEMQVFGLERHREL